MKTSYLKMSVFAFALIAAVACGKKKADNTAVNGRDSRVSVGPSNLPTGQGNMQRQGTTITPADQNFEETVKVLASATVDPQYIGSIRHVDIAGQVSGNWQTGAVNGGTASYVQIAIVDSNVGTDSEGNEIPPIVIKVANAVGQVSNAANLTFTDDYGSIMITGTFEGQNFRGTVRFANKKPGFNNRQEGILGSFVVPACAFFVCN